MTSLKVEWLDRKIKENDIKYIEYTEFCNLERIGEGGFGIINKADWIIGEIEVALKSPSINENQLEGFFKELNLLRIVNIHPNINQILGITKDLEQDMYILVLQYANQGNLREYLKTNSSILQWKDKIQMALDITLGLKYLHSKEIIHRDLHSKNILVHNNKLMIADFGLSKQLSEESSNSRALGMAAYVEPQCYKENNYKKDKKSDIYSLGVLLWELTSKHPPFHHLESHMISISINNGARETPIKNTPLDYIRLYQKCWNDDPALRPEIDEVHEILTHLKSQSNTINEQQECQITLNLNDLNINDEGSSTSISVSSGINNLNIDEYLSKEQTSVLSTSTSNPLNNSVIITEFGNETLYQENDGDGNILDEQEIQEPDMLNELIQAYLNFTDIGWSKSFSFNKVLEKYKSKSKKIFKYLIDNPTTHHYEVMAGKFYKKGFGIDKNVNTAFEWYMKAIEKGDIYGYYEVGNSHYDKKDYEKAIEFYQLAGSNIALRRLADCHQYDFGVQKDKSKIFELYKKSAENGFIPSQYDLANCYKNGDGIQENKSEALKWFKSFQENDGYANESNLIKGMEKLKQEIQELRNALDEIIKEYLNFTDIGWSKSFNFNKILEKYESKSREIFNYLINNSAIHHYEVMVGKFYKKGFGIDKNVNIAFEWYMKAIKQDDIFGYYEAGNSHCDKGDNEKAIEFYQLAAKNGLNIALRRLADCYQYDFGVQKDKSKIFELYKQSAENGFIPSQYDLAKCYKYGDGIQENKNKALKWYKLFQKNDGYVNESILTKGIEELEQEIQELVNALDEIIQNYLKFTDIGWTKSLSFNKILEKYESKSREIFNYHINNSAIYHYEVMAGNFYKKGFGIDKNLNIAFEWYMKASNKGDMYGHYRVGCCYYNGYGVEKNHEKAIEYYQLAANVGLNIALYFLANYIHGDKYRAFKLYKKSAENGFIPSQYELANYYEYGEGTQKNEIEALKWYKLYQKNDGINDIEEKLVKIFDVFSFFKVYNDH